VANSKPRTCGSKSDQLDYQFEAGLKLAFPLFVHWANREEGMGRWAEKVRGKLHYFGQVARREGAHRGPRAKG
jgi:hypothetical protein